MTYTMTDYGYGCEIADETGRSVWLQGDDYATLLGELDQTHDRWTDQDVLGQYSEVVQ